MMSEPLEPQIDVRVLLVEDNPGDARLIQEYLAVSPLLRCDLTLAPRLAAAIEALSEGGIDVVLLDLTLPDSRGLSTVEQVLAAAPGIPVIVLTGLDNVEFAIQALRIGAQDYLTKDLLVGGLPDKSIRYAIERARAEEALRRANRAYHTLSDCNQVVVRANDESQLLQDICRVIVEVGQYLMAWVGFVQHDEARSVHPAAHYGNQDGYLEVLNLTWADTERGRGPGGTAARTGQPAVAQHIRSDPQFAPWRREAVSRGYESSIALPLLADEEVIGILAIYSGQPSAFDEAETALLAEMAGDLAYGIAALRARKALAASEAKYRSLFNEAPDMIHVVDLKGTILDANWLELETLGYTRDELIGKIFFDTVVHPDERARARKLFTKVKKGEHLDGVEFTFVNKDGDSIPVEVSSVPQLADGQVIGARAFVRDITNRKQAEKAERDQRLLAEALQNSAAMINSTLHLDEVLERILDIVADVVPHSGANVILIDPEDDTLHVVRYCNCYEKNGLPLPQINRSVPVSDLPHLARMVESGQPCIVADTRNNPDWRIITEEDWMRSYASAPIAIQGRVIGFLNMDSDTPGFFTQDHVERLKAFADQAAIAVRNAQLYQELERHSTSLAQAVEERTAELRQITERVATILNNSPDAILLLDGNGEVETANPAFYALFGFSEDEIFGKRPLMLAMPDHADSLKNTLNAVIEGRGTRRQEISACRKDGTVFDADLAIAPIIEGGSLDGLVCSIRDISVLKEVERLKDSFVSNVSHELRTPIASLKLNHDLIARDPERQGVYLSRMKREVERLSGTVEDLLNLSRLQRGRVQADFTTVDLHELAQQYLDDRTPMAVSSNLTLSLEHADDIPLVEADPGLIGQVISIVLTNAMTYTPPGGQITLRTHCKRVGIVRWAGLSVSDTGPGVPLEEMPHLFERFFRGKVGRDSGVPGTGLGLAIVQEIIDLHHGRVEVASEGIPGKGATLTFWLPETSEDTGA
jgi:PAS domain S-box-containing protein